MWASKLATVCLWLCRGPALHAFWGPALACMWRFCSCKLNAIQVNAMVYMWLHQAPSAGSTADSHHYHAVFARLGSCQCQSLASLYMLKHCNAGLRYCYWRPTWFLACDCIDFEVCCKHASGVVVTALSGSLLAAVLQLWEEKWSLCRR